MKKFETTLKVVCVYCGAELGEKDGQGVEGISGGVCRKCAKRERANLKRSSLIKRVYVFIRRFYTTFREMKLLEELDREANDRAAHQDAFMKNPKLHFHVLIQGREGLHYIDATSAAKMIDATKDDPDMKPRWN